MLPVVAGAEEPRTLPPANAQPSPQEQAQMKKLEALLPPGYQMLQDTGGGADTKTALLSYIAANSSKKINVWMVFLFVEGGYSSQLWKPNQDAQGKISEDEILKIITFNTCNPTSEDSTQSACKIEKTGHVCLNLPAGPYPAYPLQKNYSKSNMPYETSLFTMIEIPEPFEMLESSFNNTHLLLFLTMTANQPQKPAAAKNKNSGKTAETFLKQEMSTFIRHLVKMPPFIGMKPYWDATLVKPVMTKGCP
jgi:hypothetical protein